MATRKRKESENSLAGWSDIIRGTLTGDRNKDFRDSIQRNKKTQLILWYITLQDKPVSQQQIWYAFPKLLLSEIEDSVQELSANNQIKRVNDNLGGEFVSNSDEL